MTHQDSIQVVKPGDGIVTGKNIPAYKNSWEMTALNPDGNIVNRGIWNDEVSFYKDNDGNEILKRKQRVEYQDRISIQEEEVYRNNLQHIRLMIYTEGQIPHTDIKYDGNRIWGKKIFRVAGLYNIQQISMPFSFELPEPVFDWHLWGILISGFPLKVGYKARFLAHESYSYLPGDFRWFTLRVTGSEVIDGGIWGNVNCYTVEVEAEVLWKLWIAIDKSIPPVQQIRIDDNDGVQFWWRPIKK
uniref:Uncharacterized protein n=1 Tax=Ignavibacterium album TaxID=591197 RepID=A0A7V3E739_9BACT